MYAVLYARAIQYACFYVHYCPSTYDSMLLCRLVYAFHYASLHVFLQNIHCPFSLATGPQPLPKPILHTVHRATSFNFQHPLVSLRPWSSCLPLHHRLPVISIHPSILPSIMCFRRQFLRNTWPIQLPFLHFTVYRIFLNSLTLGRASPFLTRSIQLIFSF